MHGLRLRSLIPSWLILVFGLAGACLNAQCVYADSATEVPLERLTVREKHFSLGGTNGYFTGWVTEQYPTGLLKSRSSVTNGLLEGLSEGWHTNGVKQVEEHYRAGVSHGLRVKWDENGQVVSEATVVGGKIEGVFRRWHSNGVLAEEIAMKGNLPDGPSRSYYPSGCPKAKASMSKGQLKEQRFWKDGELLPSPQALTNAPAKAGSPKRAHAS